MEIPPIKPTTSEQPAWLREGINLKMTAKGYYYWEINSYGELNAGLVAKIKQIDNLLKAEFPQNVTTISQNTGE